MGIRLIDVKYLLLSGKGKKADIRRLFYGNN